jgi:hypothetical protein
MHSRTLHEDYAFALCAHEGSFGIKVDASNAYTILPPPNQSTYVDINQPCADWFLICYGFDVPLDHVAASCATRLARASRIQCFLGAFHQQQSIALQGLKSTAHKCSLYNGIYDGWKMLISQQVDDLAIGCGNVALIL